MSSPQQITQLLIDWSNGDQAALDQLMTMVYQELRQMAHRVLRSERGGHTLQTTALVNEAYVRLVDYKNINLQHRAQFFAITAKVMRHVLIDYARAQKRDKREGDREKISFDTVIILSKDRGWDMQSQFILLLALDEAMAKLKTIDSRKSEVIEMRVFGGMSNAEIAKVLKISENTVMRDWNFAEAWLRRELSL